MQRTALRAADGDLRVVDESGEDYLYAAHYGAHAYDNWDVDGLLRLAAGAARATRTVRRA